MASVIKLSDKLLDDAKAYGNATRRTPPKQIEYWARLGQIAEENPDLSFRFVQDILVTLKDIEKSKSGGV